MGPRFSKALPLVLFKKTKESIVVKLLKYLTFLFQTYKKKNPFLPETDIKYSIRETFASFKDLAILAKESM